MARNEGQSAVLSADAHLVSDRHCGRVFLGKSKMADNARERPFPGYFKQLNGLTSDFLEPKSKRKKAYSGGGGFYEVERVITRRNSNGKENYLLKWSGYSYYSCTWEEEDNLTPDLLRTFERPVVAESRLQQNIDGMLLAIHTSLKSKSRAQTTFNFHHDCYRLLFGAKGIQSADGKSKMLTRNDFVSCKFDFAWDQCLDKLGDGVRIKFPIKMRPILSWSPQMSAVYNGELKQVPRMPVEKLTIEFVRQPFSILNA